MKKRRKLDVLKRHCSGQVYWSGIEFSPAQFEDAIQRRSELTLTPVVDSVYGGFQAADWLLVIAVERSINTQFRYGVVQAGRLDANGRLRSGDLVEVEWVYPWSFLTPVTG